MAQNLVGYRDGGHVRTMSVRRRSRAGQRWDEVAETPKEAEGLSVADGLVEAATARFDEAVGAY
jgi:hypothetical protein